jgi:hypothetical protein
MEEPLTVAVVTILTMEVPGHPFFSPSWHKAVQELIVKDVTFESVF